MHLNNILYSRYIKKVEMYRIIIYNNKNIFYMHISKTFWIDSQYYYLIVFLFALIWFIKPVQCTNLIQRKKYQTSHRRGAEQSTLGIYV